MPIIEISCVEVWKEISNYLNDEISAELREGWNRTSKDARTVGRFLQVPKTS